MSVLFRNLPGLKRTIVFYRGSVPAILDVMSGQTHCLVGLFGASHAHIRAVKLKTLVTGRAKRTPLLPDLPTIAGADVADYDAENDWTIATPAGTPSPIVRRVSTEIGRALKAHAIQTRFVSEGAEVDGRPAVQTERLIRAEIAKWTRVPTEK